MLKVSLLGALLAVVPWTTSEGPTTGGLSHRLSEEWDPISLMDECREAECFGFFTVLEVQEKSAKGEGYLLLRADEILFGDCPKDDFKVPYWDHLYSNSLWILVEKGQRGLLSLGRWEDSEGRKGGELEVRRFREATHVVEYRLAIEAWNKLPQEEGPERLRAEFDWLVRLLESPALYQEALYDLMPNEFEQVYPLKPDRFSKWIGKIPLESWQKLFAHLGPSDSFSAGNAWQLWFREKPLEAYEWLKLQPARSDGDWKHRLFSPTRSFWYRIQEVLSEEDSTALYPVLDSLGQAVRVRDNNWKSDGPTVAQAIAKLQQVVDNLQTPAQRASEIAASREGADED